MIQIIWCVVSPKSRQLGTQMCTSGSCVCVRVITMLGMCKYVSPLKLIANEFLFCGTTRNARGDVGRRTADRACETQVYAKARIHTRRGNLRYSSQIY